MPQASEREKLLVIGGYGTIGGRAAQLLAEFFEGRIVVGGPNEAKAQQFADASGHGMQGIALDATDPAQLATALGDHRTVVNTVDSLEEAVVDAAIAAGTNYVGVVGTDVQAIRARHNDARTTGSRILLGTGVMPGISNVIARKLSADLGGADRIVSTAVGDAGSLGPQTFSYMLQEAAKPLVLPGAARPTMPYAVSVQFRFPEPREHVTAYAVCDWFSYADTLGAESVTAILMEPAPLRQVMHLAARARITKALAVPRIRRLVARGLLRVTAGMKQGPMLIGVEVSRDGKSASLCAAGASDAEWTSQGVATLAAHVHRGDVEPGVWLPEQVIEPAPYLADLERRGLKLAVP